MLLLKQTLSLGICHGLNRIMQVLVTLSEMDVKVLPMLHLWSVTIIPALLLYVRERVKADIMENMRSLQHGMWGQIQEIWPQTSTCWASIISVPETYNHLKCTVLPLHLVTGDWMDELWIKAHILLISLLQASHSPFTEELVPMSGRSVYCQVECSITCCMSAAGLHVNPELSLTILLCEYKESRSRIYSLLCWSLWPSMKSKDQRYRYILTFLIQLMYYNFCKTKQLFDVWYHISCFLCW